MSRVGDRNQFPSVGAIRVSDINVRSFGQGELAPVWRPDSRVPDKIGELTGSAGGDGESPELRFRLRACKIGRQKMRMIARNVAHSDVCKWSSNERSITAGDRRLSQKRTRSARLNDEEP
jgi:hypothetical protein